MNIKFLIRVKIASRLSYKFNHAWLKTMLFQVFISFIAIKQKLRRSAVNDPIFSFLSATSLIIYLFYY